MVSTGRGDGSSAVNASRQQAVSRMPVECTTSVATVGVVTLHAETF